MKLTDANSWLCEVHPQLRCRVYPKTKAELKRHYDAAKRRQEEPLDSWRGWQVAKRRGK